MLVLDVDGVLSDGRISYTSDGQEIKSFHIQDGLGIKLLMNAGIEVGIITGRISAMVARRSEELGIETLIQGREDKLAALEEMLSNKPYGLESVAYLGDDLPDYLAIKHAGFGMAPADAHSEILQIADWVSARDGGRGAVRDACDLLMKEKNLYQMATSHFKDDIR